MFKLVGKESFTVGTGQTRATINIDAISGFTYEYTLHINGKSLERFTSDRAKATKTWTLLVDGEDYRVVLGEPRERQQKHSQLYIDFSSVFLAPLRIRSRCFTRLHDLFLHIPPSYVCEMFKVLLSYNIKGVCTEKVIECCLMQLLNVHQFVQGMLVRT